MLVHYESEQKKEQKDSGCCPFFTGEKVVPKKAVKSKRLAMSARARENETRLFRFHAGLLIPLFFPSPRPPPLFFSYVFLFHSVNRIVDWWILLSPKMKGATTTTEHN